eukprot:tig00000823_g4557.t1
MRQSSLPKLVPNCVGPTPFCASKLAGRPAPGGSGSGGLVVSKSTVYVANLDYNLTNNDIHQLFSPHGKIAKVTVVRDKETRASKGLAFILFKTIEDAQACVAAMNGSQVSGRTIKCSIARDNGRASEFIKRKEYKDKSRCFECGSEGHLSFECPRNQLGDRPRPTADKTREKKRRRREREDAAKQPRRADADKGSSGEGEGGSASEDDEIGLATLAAGAPAPRGPPAGAPPPRGPPGRPRPAPARAPAGPAAGWGGPRAAAGAGEEGYGEAEDAAEESWAGPRPLPAAAPGAGRGARNPLAEPHAVRAGYFSDEDGDGD